MESNLDCNHTNDEKNRRTAKRKSDLLITSMISAKLDDKKACYQLIKTMTKFGKEARHWSYVFRKGKTNSLLGEMRDNSARMTSSVPSYRHDVLKVP